MKHGLPFLAAVSLTLWLVSAGSGGGYSTLPTYTSNPYTGRQVVSGGYYNPYTGGGAEYRSTYNPYTGRQTQSAAGYNSWTGNSTVAHSSYNPWTGTSRRSVTRRR